MSNLFQAKRHLIWPDCYNARDLGGLPAVDGAETAWGAVIRTDTLNRLTAVGRSAMLEYGICTVIDVRSFQETEKYPSDLADFAEVDYLNLPLEAYYPHVSQLIGQAQNRGEVYCIILDHYPDLMASVMRAIIDARPGGVVIHCHAGKDRTGIVAGLLLGLAGVPADLIAADYAESQQRLWPLYEQRVAEVGGPDKVGFWGRPTVTADMMEQMLAHLLHNYGGVTQYLRQAGLSADELKLLKNRLLER